MFMCLPLSFTVTTTTTTITWTISKKSSRHSERDSPLLNPLVNAWSSQRGEFTLSVDMCVYVYWQSLAKELQVACQVNLKQAIVGSFNRRKRCDASRALEVAFHVPTPSFAALNPRIHTRRKSDVRVGTASRRVGYSLSRHGSRSTCGHSSHETVESIWPSPSPLRWRPFLDKTTV